MPSKIEWTEETWNPITGCSKISTGCKNCYAERMSKRLAGRYGYDKENPFSWTVHPSQYDKIRHWRKPRQIFVCSMGDLFLYGEGAVSKRHLEQREVFMAAKRNSQHTYLFLTKRPENMLWWSKRFTGWWGEVPRNWWFGVTAENQEMADKRIPILLQIPAAVRFVSVEPMLSAVLLTGLNGAHADVLNGCEKWNMANIEMRKEGGHYESIVYGKPKINWVIAGGESGHGARPIELEWIRSIRDQCVNAEVPFFFKQWGSNPSGEAYSEQPMINAIMVSKKGGRILDGELWNQYPE